MYQSPSKLFLTHLTVIHENDVEALVNDKNDQVNNILIAKGTAMAVLFCASVLCGSLPFLLNRYFKWTEKENTSRSALIVQCLLYFGGGVLLATIFLHLLPEIRDTVQEMEECNVIPTLGFSLSELLMCTGFFFIFFFEEALHLILNRQEKNEESAAFERVHSVRKSFLLKDRTEKIAELQTMDTAEAVAKLEAIDEEKKQSSSKIIDYAANGDGHGHGHSHSHLPITEGDNTFSSSLRGLFVVLALSLHELFEGMAIGLETSSAAAVWFLFGAVSAHKLVLAFCVGVELIVARTRFTLSIIYVITFAIVSPIGIGIGILISNGSTRDNSSNVASVILQGLACGTLLYVVFFEILSKERSGLRTYFAMIFGFAVMFALQRLTTEKSHGHSHLTCEEQNDNHTKHHLQRAT